MLRLVVEVAVAADLQLLSKVDTRAQEDLLHLVTLPRTQSFWIDPLPRQDHRGCALYIPKLLAGERATMLDDEIVEVGRMCGMVLIGRGSPEEAPLVVNDENEFGQVLNEAGELAL